MNDPNWTHSDLTMSDTPTIIYTHTDEAPALATYSFLPIVKAYAGGTGISVETRDISLAGRIIANFPEALRDDQRIDDALAELGRLTQSPSANIVKLPNISASIPQLKAAISELQANGYALPDYPEDPQHDAEREAKARYDRVKGSAVNPVLREGNSDRRAPKAVKAYARANPPRMGKWTAECATHVASMPSGDFFGNEQSVTMPAAATARVEHVANDGSVTVLRDGLELLEGEVVDATFMSRDGLVAFLAEQVADARSRGVLFSLHLKATMMKVSDPIIFGHAVRVFFADVFDKHGATLDRIGVDVNNGFGDLLSKIASLPDAERAPIEADIESAYAAGPGLAMVDSDRGITNLHVPSDIIIDASMPNDGPRLPARCGTPTASRRTASPSSLIAPTRACIRPTIDFCQDAKTNGAVRSDDHGHRSNVGLMAQKAEEYGSHDKTFEAPAAGTYSRRRCQRLRRFSSSPMPRPATSGVMCQAKDAPIRDWVRSSAVSRARATGAPAVFWLDAESAHDAAADREGRPVPEGPRHRRT